MADNTTLNLATTAGDVIATDDIAGVKYQRVKNTFGADGVATDVSATNPFPVIATSNGVVSTANSTAVNLGAGVAFTGTFEEVTEHATVMVSVFASHASATDGLSVQFSSDGVNADLLDTFTIPAATGKTFSFGVLAKFYRLVYTNGATLTTSLRIQTLFSRASKKFSSQRPGDARSNDNDFEEELSHLMLFNGTTWDRARGTTTTGQLSEVTRINELRASALHVTATAAVNTAITATLPAPGAGLFHYIISVELVKLYSVVGVAAGAGVLITSTNLPGSPVWTTEQAAGAVGTAPKVISYVPTTPLKSSAANTATTFVAPAQLQTIWRWNISYFTAA